MVKKIPLQNGLFALVDDEDWKQCMEYTWYISYDKTGKHLAVLALETKQRLSYFILKIPSEKGMVVTFLNREQLDHQKKNLMRMTINEANQRSRKNSNTISIYKGVTWNENLGKWVANINPDKKRILLGHFDSEDDAAEAYNLAAISYFGEHSFQNIIGQDNAAPLLDKVIGYPRRIKANENTASIYRGVVFNNQTEGWTAYCSKEYLGSFLSDIDAAIAYNIKAEEIYGDKAILNSIPEGHIPTDRIPARESKEYMVSKGYSSNYVGVSWDKNRNKWLSSIRRKKKNVFQKRFYTEIEAALAYDKKAFELDGDEAKLNFPELIKKNKV